MQPVVVPPRSSQTRSVLARFLVRVSGYGIFTEVTRLMTLRTSSRSAAETGMLAVPNSTIASIRYAGLWSMGIPFLKGGETEARTTVCRHVRPVALNLAATHQGI